MSVRPFSSIRRALATRAILAVGVAAGIAQAAPQAQRGEDLFLGKAEMQGKPRGHESSFPAQIVRCANCHGAGKLTLSADLLSVPRQRRGGPPSVYDETTFCKLLRTGVDPAYILIDHAMPVYDMPDSDCAALWSYIMRKDPSHAGAAH